MRGFASAYGGAMCSGCGVSRWPGFGGGCVCRRCGAWFGAIQAWGACLALTGWAREIMIGVRAFG